MMNYRYVRNAETNQYDIIETSTNNAIKRNLEFLDAKNLVRHLNFGGGFDGWTPNFFLKPLRIEHEDAQNG